MSYNGWQKAAATAHVCMYRLINTSLPVCKHTYGLFPFAGSRTRTPPKRTAFENVTYTWVIFNFLSFPYTVKLPPSLFVWLEVNETLMMLMSLSCCKFFQERDIIAVFLPF